PERHEQIAPGRSEGLAGEQVAEDHAPTQQKLAGEGLGAPGGRERWMLGSSKEEGPAAGGGKGAGQSLAAFAAAALGIDQGAEVLEAVSGHQTGSRELPQAVFDLTREPACRTHELGQKRSAAAAKGFEHLPRRM